MSREDFISELCSAVAWLLSQLLLPAYITEETSTQAASIIDTLAEVFASVPDDCQSMATAIADDPLKYKMQNGVPLFVMPDKLDALLISSSLGYWFLRPIFLMTAISLSALEDKGRAACHGQLRGFFTHVLNKVGVSVDDFEELIGEVAKKLSTIEFHPGPWRVPDQGFPQNAAAIGEITRVAHLAVWEASKSQKEDELFASRIRSDNTSISGTGLDVDADQVISELVGMIGLDAVKEEVVSLANYIKVRQMRVAKGLRHPPISLHLVFSGNPGTGKTTVARFVARLYKALGVLSKGHLVEVDRGGLVSQYVGGTAIKTKEAVESALDGVLFIDEAYSLHKETTWGDVGSEAIETLLKLMEDNRDRLVVIAAGYTDKMADFIASNPGLQSRFTRHIEFDDYTADEMLQMFERSAAENSFELDADARQILLDHFREVEGDSGFGNGRGVRNTFEAVVVAHANRIAAWSTASDQDLTLFVRKDIDAAFKEGYLEDP